MKNMLLTIAALFTATLFFSCSDETDGSITLLSAESINLSHDETFQIKATSNNALNYSSANEYHAEVSSTGLITANFVGSTTITISDGVGSRSILVTVSPEVNIFDDSDFKHWGYSPSQIGAIFGTPDKTSGDYYYYYDYSYYISILGFAFENNDLYMTPAIISTSYTTKLTEFLLERYQVVYYDEDDYAFMFMDSLDVDDINTYVMLDLCSTSYWALAYFDADYLDSTKTKVVDGEVGYKALFEELRAKALSVVME